MTEITQDNQAQNVAQNQASDKELNFRRQEQMYQRILQEREQRIQELEQDNQLKLQEQDDDDEDDDAYVDKKKLNKKLEKASKNTEKNLTTKMERIKNEAKEELRNEMWLEQHVDFDDVMEKHAENFAHKHPNLAKSILKMPEGFERQKLVYQTIKGLGLDQPEKKEPSIQDKANQNRQTPYYQPSGIANSPYSFGGDFSQSGQKAAYEKMQELRNRLRI